MKKAGFLLGLLLLIGLNIQCTEDDEMDAQMAKENNIVAANGEEGGDGLDNKKDE